MFRESLLLLFWSNCLKQCFISYWLGNHCYGILCLFYVRWSFVTVTRCHTYKRRWRWCTHILGSTYIILKQFQIYFSKYKISKAAIEEEKQPTRKQHLKMAIPASYVTLDNFLLCFIDLYPRWGIVFPLFSMFALFSVFSQTVTLFSSFSEKSFSLTYKY
jgi:hypothetical protein